MANAIIVVNSGSTSLKFGAYAMDATGPPPLLCRGQIDAVAPRTSDRSASREQRMDGARGTRSRTSRAALRHYLAEDQDVTDMKVVAAGHRVVLSDAVFEAPRERGRRAGLPRLAGRDGAVAPDL